MGPVHVRHGAFLRHVPPGARRERLDHVAMSTPVRLAEAGHGDFARVGHATQPYLHVPLYERDGSLWTPLAPETERPRLTDFDFVGALEGRIPFQAWTPRMLAHFDGSPVLPRTSGSRIPLLDMEGDGIGRVAIDGRDRASGDAAAFMASTVVMTERGPMGRIGPPIAEAEPRSQGRYRLAIDVRRSGEPGRFVAAERLDELVALDRGVRFEGDPWATLGVMLDGGDLPEMGKGGDEDMRVLANLLPWRVALVADRMMTTRHRQAVADAVGGRLWASLRAWEALGSTGSVSGEEVADALGDSLAAIDRILPFAHSSRPFLLGCSRFVREVAMPRMEAAPDGPDVDALAALGPA